MMRVLYFVYVDPTYEGANKCICIFGPRDFVFTGRHECIREIDPRKTTVADLQLLLACLDIVARRARRPLEYRFSCVPCETGYEHPSVLRLVMFGLVMACTDSPAS